MSVFKMLITAALISTATISSASAAWTFADQESSTFAAIYPDRDVLNGGAFHALIAACDFRAPSAATGPPPRLRAKAKTIVRLILLIRHTHAHVW